MKTLSLSVWCYFLGIIGLFLYSYTQVDLSLTLSQMSLYQTIEKSFQYIGYFNRPLSTYLYVGLLIFLFTFYIRLLNLAIKGKIQKQTFWLLTILTTIVLTFSYNAFSYDIFNNIFDAKIITHYHLNPYQHKALDFPQDPMLSFMHWIERTYPYGPFWLAFSVPLSFMGANIFIITFFLFKIFAGFSYLGTVFFIEKITQHLDKKSSLLKTMLFALNPLVLIEGLLSAHNDMTMFFFGIFALYLLMNHKALFSGLSLCISVGIKFATGFITPVFLVVWVLQIVKKKINWERVFLFCLIFMVPALVAVTMRTTFQPWYLLYVLPFAALIGNRLWLIVPSILASFIALTEYIPFLYTGNWDPPIPFILNTITFSGVIVCLCSIILLFFFKSKRHVLQ